MPANAPSVVFIGGGPRAAGVLERLAANRPALFAGPLDIHVVEPYEPGSGRIWRYDQHPGLMLNSAAADITMFTDSSVACEGPAADGPGLAEWAAGVLDGSITDVPDFPLAIREQLRTLTGATFPTRQLQSQYLEWFFRRAVTALGGNRHRPPHHRRRHRARRAAPPSAASDAGTHLVRLANGGDVRADVVVTALGHTDSRPDAASEAWSGFAARHGGFHAAPSYTTDVDYSPLAPGQDVIVAGMGLAFVDLLVLLTEGRGGRFEETPDGGLRYVASGREPRLLAGSRRGVPYHSKVSAALRGEAPGDLRFFTRDAVDALLELHAELDFRSHLWPLIAKEAGYGYYRELFTGSPERVSQAGTNFPAASPRSTGTAPPARTWWPPPSRTPRLHLDLERLDRPFAGQSFAGHAEVQDAVAEYIEHDLALRDGPDHPETMALFVALLKVYMDLGRLVPPERLNARSQQTVHGWWHGFFSFVDSGPPPRRLREMLALHRAGLLDFLGPESPWTRTSPPASSWQRRRSRAWLSGRRPSSRPGCRQRRWPGSLNPALQSVHAAGLGTEQQLLTADGIHSTGKLLVSGKHQLVDAQGRAQDRIFGIGPGTSGWGAGAFARPGTNAAPFRENDALARHILTVAAGLHPAAPSADAAVASQPAHAATRPSGAAAAAQPAAVGKA